MSLPLRPREAVASWAGSLYAEHFEPSFRLGSGHVTREHGPSHQSPATPTLAYWSRAGHYLGRATLSPVALNERCPNVINGKNAS